MDPRNYQVSALTGLLLYGVLQLGFEVGPQQIFLTLGSVLATQWAAGRWFRLPSVDYRSSLISGLSLCLLGRAENPGWQVMAGVIAILSKFLVRWRGKHVFNPTNVALASVLLLSGGSAWVSPGQWGSVAVLAFLFVCLGGLVVMRAGRADVTLTFLVVWSALLFGRAWWLGDPATIPWHRLESGSLLLFAFFMISDPRTTPDSRTGRMLFALLVAVSAWWWQFLWFHNNGLIWSLVVWSPVVPLLDAWLPASRHQWLARRSAAVPAAPPSTNPSLSVVSVPFL